MTIIFHDMINILMEEYVDHLLGKSVTQVNHLDILDKIFTWAKKYKLHLNLKKCVFGVTSRNLLGYIISQIGIKFYPKKVKTI